MSMKFLSSVDIEGTCLEIPNIQITSGATSGAVLTSDATGLGKWCETVDISTNIGTGQLLYYDGATISGSSLIQNSTTNMTFNGQCLNLDSTTGTKYIQMCPIATTLSANPLHIVGTTNCCCIGGDVYICGGISHRIINAGMVRGGGIGICGGCACHEYSSGAARACGGDINICGGNACNCYDYYSCGGNVNIYAGNGWATTGTYANGGEVRIQAGYGYAGGGDVCILTGGASSCANVGFVCIGNGYSTTCPTKLLIKGHASTYGLYLYCGCGLAPSGWATSSDVRIKTNVQPVLNALSKVIQLSGVTYCQCDDDTCEEQLGLIAQDVLPVLPDVVGCHEISNDEVERYGFSGETYSIKYDKLAVVLIEAIKEQQIQICNLQQEINTLKGI